MSEPVPREFAQALRQLDLAPFGEPLVYFTETGSTNDEAARLAERGAVDGTTVLAAAQTAGRGRLGRQWHSPPEAGLYVSVLCRKRQAAPFLTLAGGVSVADGIRAATGLPVEIKWPNDVVVPSGAGSVRRRKVAGVLAEAAVDASGLHFVVLGMGVNVRPAAYPPSIAGRATSLETELGRPVDAAPLLGHLLSMLATHYRCLAAGETTSLLRRWRELAPTAQGAAVECDTVEGRLPGVTAGIADDGALLVRIGARTERVIAGEILWK